MKYEYSGKQLIPHDKLDAEFAEVYYNRKLVGWYFPNGLSFSEFEKAKMIYNFAFPEFQFIEHSPLFYNTGKSSSPDFSFAPEDIVQDFELYQKS